MYVCLCNSVTESDIERAVKHGARSLACLASRLAVSTCCGQCQPYADACLRRALRAMAASDPSEGGPALQS